MAYFWQKLRKRSTRRPINRHQTHGNLDNLLSAFNMAIIEAASTANILLLSRVTTSSQNFNPAARGQVEIYLKLTVVKAGTLLTIHICSKTELGIIYYY